MSEGLTAEEFRRQEIQRLSQGQEEKSFEEAFKKLQSLDDSTLRFINGGG